MLLCKYLSKVLHADPDGKDPKDDEYGDKVVHANNDSASEAGKAHEYE